MNFDSSIEIDAPTSVVWDVFADVERWPEWTKSVTSIVALDGPGIEVGKRFEIKQPRLPKVVWQVTEVDPGRSWTWRTHAPGNTTTASHSVVAADGGSTHVEQRIEQRGPGGFLVGVLLHRLTKRYLALEAAGLKACSEQHHRHRAPTA